MTTATDPTNIQAWLAERVAKDDQLYERFGRPLEADHAGELVAISDEGDLILGTDELDLATKSVNRFGSGRFALRRIGADAEIRWRATAR